MDQLSQLFPDPQSPSSGSDEDSSAVDSSSVESDRCALEALEDELLTFEAASEVFGAKLHKLPPIHRGLRATDYCREVLQLPPWETEEEADLELVQRARAVGIPATLPPVARKKPTNSNHDADSFLKDQPSSDAFHETASTTAPTRRHHPSSSPRAERSSSHHHHIGGSYSPPLVERSSSHIERSSQHIERLSFQCYENCLKNYTAPSREASPVDRASQAAQPSNQALLPKERYRTSLQSLRDLIRRGSGVSTSKKVKVSCHACPNTFKLSMSLDALQKLRCGHLYCVDCIMDKINRAAKNEHDMPPKCCDQPLPAGLVEHLLSIPAQETFLLAVMKFSTPTEERVICSDPACGAFLPWQATNARYLYDRPSVHDPKHPCDLFCIKCKGRTCMICKKKGHDIGDNCPYDWELTALQQHVTIAVCKRCYSCRSLLEAVPLSPFISCQCQAQVCSVCAGIWDPTTGCPNSCDFNNHLIRRREEITTMLQQRIVTAPPVSELSSLQKNEFQRFLDFKEQVRDDLDTQHLLKEEHMEQRLKVQEAALCQLQEMELTALEDDHVVAEMELLDSMQQEEKLIRLRIRHMEAYCHGLGRNPNSLQPVRVVTERDLRELGEQYNLRDDMDRRREAGIKMMRERQALEIEDFRGREKTAFETLKKIREERLKQQAMLAALDNKQFDDIFASRLERLHTRWLLAMEVLCREQAEPDRMMRLAAPSGPTFNQIDVVDDVDAGEKQETSLAD